MPQILRDNVVYRSFPEHWRALPTPLHIKYESLAGAHTERDVIGERTFTAKTTGRKIFTAIDVAKEAYRSFVIPNIEVAIPKVAERPALALAGLITLALAKKADLTRDVA